MKRRLFGTIILLSSITASLLSQVFNDPNYSLKSHETLNIIKIEATSEGTVFYMTIENRINGGTFCADKNLFIIYPDGRRSKLISSKGIPVCPDNYEFKTPGEKLEFSLTFPPLKEGTSWIDLIEDCSDNCFSFYGITLDNDLNRKIDEAYSKINLPDPSQALKYFISILEETDKKNLGSEGMLYINIINLEKKAGNKDQAAEWYKKFLSSGAPGLPRYIKYLNELGIKY